MKTGVDRNLRLKRSYRLLRRCRFSDGQGTRSSAEHSSRTRATRHDNPARYRLLKSSFGVGPAAWAPDVER